MLVKTAVLCAIEAVIAVLLALQVFRTADRENATAAPAATASPSTEAATAVEAALPVPSAASRSPSPTSVADIAPGARSEAAAKWRANDPVGVVLTGTVRGRDGKPAEVSMSASLDKKLLGARTVEGGSYALVGLQPGEWTITLRGASVVETKSTLSITDDAVQHHDFVVAPSFPVKVTIVTPDGADATSAKRTALLDFDDFMVAGQRDRFPDRLAPTDYGVVFVGDAKWDPERNPKDGVAGTLHLAAVPAHVALLQCHLVLEQQLVQPGQREVKFVVDLEALKKLAGSATVRVLDAATGEPLTQARVLLGTSNRGGPGRPVDAEGRAVLEGLSPGLLHCEINAPDREMMRTMVRVDSGQRLDLGDARLGAVKPLRGMVLDAEGNPANAELTWTELKWRTAPTEFIMNRGTRTEADGSFSLWGTGSGAIAVRARDAAGNMATGVFDNPPANPVVLRLAKSCRCVVTRPRDLSRAFTLTLFDGNRRAIAARYFSARLEQAGLAMPAGDYTFEVHDEQHRLVQTGVLTFGATPCAVEIR